MDVVVIQMQTKFYTHEKSLSIRTDEYSKEINQLSGDSNHKRQLMIRGRAYLVTNAKRYIDLIMVGIEWT